jgi:hypothetical protein
VRDLERHAGLFADDPAMRPYDARPDGDSPPGGSAAGLPYASTSARLFAAQMTRIAHESSASAQHGPTEGFEETWDCILEVMAARMHPDRDD